KACRVSLSATRPVGALSRCRRAGVSVSAGAGSGTDLVSGVVELSGDSSERHVSELDNNHVACHVSFFGRNQRGQWAGCEPETVFQSRTDCFRSFDAADRALLHYRVESVPKAAEES